MISENRVNVILQGKYDEYSDEIIESYLNIPCVNDVIVSCWKDNKDSVYPKYFSDRVKFVRNDYPESPGTDNRNLQIYSSLQGLKKSNTMYSVKMRSDQKYTHDSMMKMFDFFMENKDKVSSYQHDYKKPKGTIFVAGLYFNLLFCPRDHIFWGYTEDLIDLFDIPLEKYGLIDQIKVAKQQLHNYYNYFIRTETYIGAHYCAKFNDEINTFILRPNECLHDGGIYWYYSKDVSIRTITKAFLPFSKDVIDFEWPCKPDFYVEGYTSVTSWYEDLSDIFENMGLTF
jgi:hypothetical protein